MRNMWLVLRHELYSILSKPSFWLTTFLIPLLVVGMNVGSQLLVSSATRGESETFTIPASGQAIAYVDEAGLIRKTLPQLPAGALQAFTNRQAAREALRAGEISQYYVIPDDFLETGKLLLIVNRISVVQPQQQAMFYLLSLNLVDDPTRAAALVQPLLSVEGQALASQEPGREESLLSTAVPLATIMIFFFVLTFTGSFMLQSVTREKENRTAEVLLVSLRPRELMMGKILGLGVVGLAQMAVWLGGGVLALGQARQLTAGAASFALPASFFVWGVLYFLLGYLLYASAVAGLGALAPTAREGNQVTFVIIVPLMIPLLASAAFGEAPNGAVATFLSLFPLTAPVSMVTRLAVGGVPFWQPLLGLLALAATTYLVMLLAGRLFRADTLLSGNALNWDRLKRELRR